MDNHKSKNIRSLVEIAGVMAVVLSLVFVGYEIRQNTAAVQAATMQALTDGSQEYLMLLSSDSELTAIRMKARSSPELLTDIEADRYRSLRRSRWVRFQNAFSQYQRGTLGHDDWSFYEGFVCNAERSEWEDHKGGLTKSFVDFVEACMEVND